MRIFTEADVNAIAFDLVENIISNCFKISGVEVADDHWRLVTLGEISGVVDMARALKKTLDVTKKEDGT